MLKFLILDFSVYFIVKYIYSYLNLHITHRYGPVVTCAYPDTPKIVPIVLLFMH